MKVIVFVQENNERKITEVYENVSNPYPYGLHEVRWDAGGHGEIEGNYVIVEETQNLEDLTDNDLLLQFREQAKFELAKELERNRVTYMVNGTLDAKQQEFEDEKMVIDQKNSYEEISVYLIERNRT